MVIETTYSYHASVHRYHYDQDEGPMRHEGARCTVIPNELPIDAERRLNCICKNHSCMS